MISINQINFEYGFVNVDELFKCIENSGYFQVIKILYFKTDCKSNIQKIFDGKTIKNNNILIAPIMHDSKSSIFNIVTCAHCLEPDVLFVLSPYYTRSTREIYKKACQNYPLNCKVIFCKSKYKSLRTSLHKNG